MSFLKKKQFLHTILYGIKKKKEARKKIVNKIESLENKNSKKTGFFLLHRQRVSFFLNSSESKLILGSAQNLKIFGINFGNFLLLETNIENKEQIKEDFSRQAILTIVKVLKKKKTKRTPRVILIIPNQTFLVHFLRLISGNLESKGLEMQQKSNKNYFIESDLKNLKYGKMLKPADARVFSNEGQEDKFSFGGKIQGRRIIVSKELEKSDFLFFSPLGIRKLRSSLFRKLIFSIRLCFLDNFEVLAMQNLENLSWIFKHFYWVKKNLEIKNKRKKKVFLNFFILSASFFQDKFKILERMGFAKLIFSSRFSEKRRFKFLLPKKVIYLNFGEKEKPDKESQRFVFFKKKLFPILNQQESRGVFIFLRFYPEYLVVRNFFLKVRKLSDVNLLCFSEYTSFLEIKKRRNLIGKFENQIVLVTERFHHFFRYSFNKLAIVVFYSLPSNYEYFFELTCETSESSSGKKIFILFHSPEINQLDKIVLKKNHEKTFN